MKIIVDTREQTPFDFSGHDVQIEKRALKTGDYSVDGLEDHCAVERKAVMDIVACMTWERDRFVRELERLHEMNFAAVVCEGPIQAVVKPERSAANPNSLAGTLCAWMVRYNIAWIFAPNRKWAAAITFRLLERFERDVEKGTILLPKVLPQGLPQAEEAEA